MLSFWRCFERATDSNVLYALEALAKVVKSSAPTVRQKVASGGARSAAECEATGQASIISG